MRQWPRSRNSKRSINTSHACPADVRPILEKIRGTIQAAAPDAVETISYQIPTFKLHGKSLVHFAAWKEHIGFYATPEGNAAFRKELSKYKLAKGSVRFPLASQCPTISSAKSCAAA